MMYATHSTHKSATETEFAGQRLILDPSGAVYWPAERLLIVSDLHFEKGSFLAQQRRPLPRYDTRDTLRQCAELITHYAPQRVVCLGDSFHDHRAHDRLTTIDRNTLNALIARVPHWVWILGNHDPELPHSLQGETHARLQLAGIVLTHEPETTSAPQMIGHYHPKTRIKIGGQRVSGRVFIHDDNRFIMPAFGSYTGGLDIADPVLSSQFTSPSCFLLFRNKVWKL